MITYQQEPLCKVLVEIKDLIALDHVEVGAVNEEYTLEIDSTIYQILEDKDRLKVFTARFQGKLVGYFSVVIAPDLHYKGKLVAINDVIFLHPDYRKGTAGVKLFKFVEKCLKEDGFKQLQVTYTERFDISSLLLRLGYSKIETKFEKRLD